MNERMFPVPTSVDLNPTAKCNLDCPFCWGPDHSTPDGLSTGDWKDLIDVFTEMGTQAVVLTGGEPLVRPDIGELVRHAKVRGLRVTLSTNGILLRRRAHEVLPYVDEIGIPIDGYDSASNGRMRVGTPRAFKCALDSLNLVRSDYAGIEVTVRTIVSKVNCNYLGQIGELLAGIATQFDRWKLYQFSARGIGAKNRVHYQISVTMFRSAVRSLRARFPGLKISAQEELEGSGRYLFVGPEGEIFGVDEKGRYQRAGHWNNGRLDLSGASWVLVPSANAAHAQRRGRFCQISGRRRAAEMHPVATWC